MIAEARRRLAVAAPDAKAILFGYLDLLVIEPEIDSRRAEFVRLREALGVPGDLIGARFLTQDPK